jgi:hypothetical protein
MNRSPFASFGCAVPPPPASNRVSTPMPHPDSDPQFKARSGWFVLVCLASLLARVGRGQIPMSSGCYSQHFDTLAGAGAEAWTDNVTLPGWYASRSVAPPTITNYYAGAGSSTTGSLCSFGDIAATDRALGESRSESGSPMTPPSHRRNLKSPTPASNGGSPPPTRKRSPSPSRWAPP